MTDRKKASREEIIAAYKHQGTLASRKADPESIREAIAKKYAPKVKEVPADSKYTLEEKEAFDAEGKGLAAASKAWANRYALATDAEYWFTFCFYRDEDLMEFLRLLGLEGLGITPRSHHLATDGFVEKMGEFVSELYGWEFEPLDAEEFHAPDPVPPNVFDKEAMKKQLAYRPLPDYLNEDEEINAGLEETGDLETDSWNEIKAMERILRRGVPEDWLREHGSVDDYPCWFSVSFKDRLRKNRFLFMCGIRHIGDKYIDGYEAAYYLGLDLLRVEP